MKKQKSKRQFVDIKTKLNNALKAKAYIDALVFDNRRKARALCDERVDLKNVKAFHTKEAAENYLNAQKTIQVGRQFYFKKLKNKS